MWGCGKEIQAGDTLLFYFPHLNSIVASAVALKDAVSDKMWGFATRIGQIKLLRSPITLAEMKEMFPLWKWVTYPMAKPYLDPPIADALLKRAGFKSKALPVAIKVSGAGFGNAEQNRLVERAACKVVCKHFKNRGYKVVSREKEKVGYDFVVSKNGKELHVEVKGVSGNVQKFPITINEVDCARLDSNFRLAVVTEARSRKPRIQFFTPKEFSKRFELKPIAFFAEAR